MTHLYYCVHATRPSECPRQRLRILPTLAIFISAAKCDVLYFHQKGPNYVDNLSWHVGEGSIKISKSYNHLGIHLNSKFDPGERTSNACRKGRQAPLTSLGILICSYPCKLKQSFMLDQVSQRQMISKTEIIDTNSLLFNLSQSPLYIFYDKIERPCTTGGT